MKWGRCEGRGVGSGRVQVKVRYLGYFCLASLRYRGRGMRQVVAKEARRKRRATPFHPPGLWSRAILARSGNSIHYCLRTRHTLPIDFASGQSTQSSHSSHSSQQPMHARCVLPRPGAFRMRPPMGPDLRMLDHFPLFSRSLTRTQLRDSALLQHRKRPITVPHTL